MPPVSRLLEPGDGERPAEKQSVFHTHLETQAPVCGSHQSKTQSLSSSTVYASWTGLWSKSRLRELTRTKRLKDRYIYQQGIPGNTTATAACGQQLTLLHATLHYAYAERPDKSARAVTNIIPQPNEYNYFA